MSSDRPDERPAVRTTIVGGRPPGSGKDIGDIPRGIEVLVSKASVDADFKALLLDQRAKAADTIGLDLNPAEAMMLDAIPAAQLEAVVARTKVSEGNRRAFLGSAAAVMLAALGVTGCDSCIPVTGIAPDRPKPKPKPEPPPTTKGIRPDKLPVTDGIRPDPPEPKVQVVTGIAPDLPKPKAPPPAPTGIRPDRPPVSRGVRPDRP